VACVGWPILKVEDCQMATFECIYFMSGKRGANRQDKGAEVGFVRPIWKNGSL